MHYKKVRRLCTEPYKDNEPVMHTLYECHAKNGTTASTIIWFLSEPKIGGYIWGIDENTKYSPYMAGQAFRYARFERFFSMIYIGMAMLSAIRHKHSIRREKT